MATEREKKIFSNTRIVRKSQEDHNGAQVWRVELDKAIFGGQYDVAVTRVPPEVANHLEPGKQYNLVLERQNKRKGDYDGAKDWMYYWGLVGIADGDAAQQDARPAGGAAPRQQATTTSEAWGSLDARIAWNSAINNGVHATPYAEMTLSAWLGEVDGIANSLYPLIRRGPLPPVEFVSPGIAEPPADDPDDDPDVGYIEGILDEQSREGKV